MKISRVWIRWGTLLALAAFPLGGCAIRAAAVRKPPVSQSASLGQLLDRLSAASSRITTLKADFSASLSDLQTRKSYSCSGVLAMARPDRFRMRGSKIMLPTLFDLLAGSGRLSLYLPGEKVVYRSIGGRETPLRGLPVIRLLTDIYLGAGDTPGQLHFVESSPSHYTVYSVAVEGARALLSRKVIFDRTDLSPVRYQYFDADGALACDIRCAHFAAVRGGSPPLPLEIAIQAPPRKKMISLHLADLRANTSLNPDLFTFSLPAGVRERPLEEYPE